MDSAQRFTLAASMNHLIADPSETVSLREVLRQRRIFAAMTAALQGNVSFPPLNDEADCLALQHENRVGFLSIAAIAGYGLYRGSGLVPCGKRGHHRSCCSSKSCSPNPKGVERPSNERESVDHLGHLVSGNV